MGHHDEAVKLLEQALTVFQRRLVGATHHETGVTLGSLGTIDVQRGDIRSAERRLRLALAIKERTLGTHHPELVPTLATLSSACRRNGNHVDARKFCQRAVDLLHHHGPGEHPHATALLAHLATLDEPSSPNHETTEAIPPPPELGEVL
jgi:hypothetical protein